MYVCNGMCAFFWTAYLGGGGGGIEEGRGPCYEKPIYTTSRNPIISGNTTVAKIHYHMLESRLHGSYPVS